MKAIKALSIVVITMVGATAFGQVVDPPTFLDGIVAWIGNLDPGVIAGGLAFIEFLLRIVPTTRALSLLVPLKYVADGLVIVLTFISNIVTTLITSLNNVVPPGA